MTSSTDEGDRAGDFDFEELIGEEFDFYGIDGNCFKLDDQVYEAVADPECGSYLGSVEICHDHHAFHQIPIARVTIENAAFDDEIYEIIDLHDDHRWLRFGSVVVDAHVDGYYTQFFFDYTPKGLELQ